MSDYSCEHGVSYGSGCSLCKADYDQQKAAAAADRKRQRDLRAQLVSDLLAYLAKRQDDEAQGLRDRLLGAVL